MTKNQFLEKITEGATDVFVYKNKEKEKGPGIKQNAPFYNPSMELNRDFSVVLVQWLVNNSNKELELLDGLAASGIRGVRFANEIKGKFKVFINDWNEKSFDLIQKNIKEKRLESIDSSNLNLNVLLSEKKFDYIDIDPFGSPVYFVHSAMRSIRNNGIIACTATDAATLCGVYPKVCWRRYAAMPFHSVCMKEIGLRILLGFICKTAALNDKGIDPIASYTTDHYFRAYVRVKNGVNKANSSMKRLQTISSGEKIGLEETKKNVGPLWMGDLQNKKSIQNVRSILFEKNIDKKKNLWKLLDLLEEEAESPRFFYTSESISSHLKKSTPKLEMIFERIKKEGFEAYRTHFTPTGFKTNAPLDIVQNCF